MNSRKQQAPPTPHQHPSLVAIFVLFGLCSLSGCVRTDLQPAPLAPEVRRLSQVNDKPLRLQIHDNFAQDTLGHQYLFMVIPFGTVRLKERKSSLQSHASQKLAELGFSPVLLNPNEKDSDLSVTLEDISVNAYDLIVTRRVSAIVEITVEYRRSPENSKVRVSARGESGAYRRFAFRDALEHALREATRKSVSSALKGLAPSFEPHRNL